LSKHKGLMDYAKKVVKKLEYVEESLVASNEAANHLYLTRLDANLAQNAPIAVTGTFFINPKT
jgi:hypothetical protein